MSKRPSKYIASFNHVHKYLTVSSATSGIIYTVSFATVIKGPVGIASAGFSFEFSIATGSVIFFLKQQKIERKSIITLLC